MPPVAGSLLFCFRWPLRPEQGADFRISVVRLIVCALAAKRVIHVNRKLAAAIAMSTVAVAFVLDMNGQSHARPVTAIRKAAVDRARVVEAHLAWLDQNGNARHFFAGGLDARLQRVEI